MPEDHDKSAPQDSETNSPGGTAAQGEDRQREERQGGSDANVNFPSTLGSDLTSGNISGDGLTGQRPIARDDYTTGDSTVGQPVDESTETTAR